MKRPGAHQIKSYAIFVDADKNHEDTFKSVTGFLTSYDQPIPKKQNEFGSNENKRVGIYIMPGSLENGMLEDLFLKTVTDHPAMPCLKDYIRCLENKLTKEQSDKAKDPQKFYFPKNSSKSKALAFLAALYEPVRGSWVTGCPTLI